MATYQARHIRSKVRAPIEASSPSEAAYALEGSGYPMELLPREQPGVYRFRRFDEPKNRAFTVVVISSLA